MIDMICKFLNIENNTSVSNVSAIVTEFSFREKISKDLYMDLKNSYKAHSFSAKSIREEAMKNNGIIKYKLRELKQHAGQQARILHVALCFLRGKKYSEVEPNVEKKNRIKLDSLEKCLSWKVANKYYSHLKADLINFLES